MVWTEKMQWHLYVFQYQLLDIIKQFSVYRQNDVIISEIFALEKSYRIMIVMAEDFRYCVALLNFSFLNSGIRDQWDLNAFTPELLVT